MPSMVYCHNATAEACSMGTSCGSVAMSATVKLEALDTNMGYSIMMAMCMPAGFKMCDKENSESQMAAMEAMGEVTDMSCEDGADVWARSLDMKNNPDKAFKNKD